MGDNRDFFREESLSSGTTVQTLHPVLLDKDRVQIKIRWASLTVAQAGLAVLKRGGIMPGARTFVTEFWTPVDGAQIDISEVRGRMEEKGILLEMTMTEANTRIDEIMSTLEDPTGVVVIRKS